MNETKRQRPQDPPPFILTVEQFEELKSLFYEPYADLDEEQLSPEEKETALWFHVSFNGYFVAIDDVGDTSPSASRRLLEERPELRAISDGSCEDVFADAVSYGLLPAVHKLLEYGRGEYLVNAKGDHPAPIFCTTDTDILRLLFEHGADPYELTWNSENFLHHCAEENIVEAVAFVPHPETLVNAENKDGYTPLYYAKSGDMVRVLAAHGADSMVSLPKGRNLLHAYAEDDRIECVASLPNADQLVDRRDDEGKYPLHYAKGRQMVRLLLGLGADLHAQAPNEIGGMHMFAAKDLAAGVIALIADGVDVDERDHLYKTSLHYAETEYMVRVLADAGADLDAFDFDGRTPLHGAPNEDVARALIENGANPNALDLEGKTPLHTVSCLEVAQQLISAGAYIDAEDDEGNTPLHTEAWNEEVTQLLLESGADPRALNALGESPLHHATRFKAVEALLRYGAATNLRSEQGFTPLCALIKSAGEEQAKMRGYLEEDPEHPTAKKTKSVLASIGYRLPGVVCLLLDAGADPTIPDKIQGKTPLDYVDELDDNCQESVRLLLQDAIADWKAKRL